MKEFFPRIVPPRSSFYKMHQCPNQTTTYPRSFKWLETGMSPRFPNSFADIMIVCGFSLGGSSSTRRRQRILRRSRSSGLRGRCTRCVMDGRLRAGSFGSRRILRATTCEPVCRTRKKLQPPHGKLQQTSGLRRPQNMSKWPSCRCPYPSVRLSHSFITTGATTPRRHADWAVQKPRFLGGSCLPSAHSKNV